jgi:hypothetical protein
LELIDPSSHQPLRPSPDGRSLQTSEGRVVAAIVRGIPRFTTDEHLESFGLQWTEFDVAHDAEDRATFAAKTGVQPEQLRGLQVLDAGCGGGR